MTTATQLRVGLVGLGRLGKHYFQLLGRELPRAQLIGVAGREALDDEFQGGKMLRFLDRSELIAHPDVDAVVICSSTDTHAQFCREALQAGKPVFCEKPLAFTMEEADSVVKVYRDIAVRTGTIPFFQMGFMRRFDLAYMDAYEEIQLDAIGDVIAFRSVSRDPERTSIEYAKNSGGMLLDMAIHDFDLARWLTGADVTEVRTIAGCLKYPELLPIKDVDHAALTLWLKHPKTKRDIIGSMDVSRTAVYGYDIFTEVLGTDGAVRVGGLMLNSMQLMSTQFMGANTLDNFMQRFGPAFKRQLTNFVDNVLDHHHPTCTLSDGIAALAVAHAARESQHDNGLPHEVTL